MTGKRAPKVAQDESLDAKMDRLACEMADDMLAKKEVEKHRTDSFKVLCGYFYSTRKIKPSAEVDDNGGSFDGWRDRLKTATGGRK